MIHHAFFSALLMGCLVEQWTSTAGFIQPSQFPGEIDRDGFRVLPKQIVLRMTNLPPRSWGEINEEYGVGSPKEISQDQPHPGVAPPDDEVLILNNFDETK